MPLYVLKDVDEDYTLVRGEDLADLLETVALEYFEDSEDIKNFIEYIKYGDDDEEED